MKIVSFTALKTDISKQKQPPPRLPTKDTVNSFLWNYFVWNRWQCVLWIIQGNPDIVSGKRWWKEGDGTRKSRGTRTHCNTYTHFLSWREKGQYPEEEMVSHCYDWSHGKVQGGRSVTFIVKLIIPSKKIPLPCSHVLSPQQSCVETLSLHAEMSWARRSGKAKWNMLNAHNIFSRHTNML